MVLLILTLPLLLAAIVFPLRGRPVVGGVILLFLLFTRVSDVGVAYNGLPSVAQPLILVIAATVFVQRTRAGGSRSLIAGIGFWGAAAVYLAVIYGSSIWAVDSGAATSQGTELAKNLVIVYVVAEIFDTPRAQRLAVWAVICAGALLAALTLFQALTQTYDNAYFGLAQTNVQQIVGVTNGQRSAGPVGDPNFYGLVLCVVVPLALLRLRDEKHIELRLAALAATVLLLGAIIQTYSRGALVTLVVLAVCMVPVARVRTGQVVAALLLLLPLLAFTPAQYWQRAGTIAQNDASIQGRTNSQEVGLAIFYDHPFLGVGADNYNATYLPYTLRLPAVDAAPHAHDLYVAMLAETGLAGFLSFGCAMLVVLRLAWRRRAEAWQAGDRLSDGLASSCLLALVAYLAGSFFLPLAYPRYIWLLVGLVLAVSLPAARRTPLSTR